MDIWNSYAARSIECKHCHQIITKGTLIYRGRTYVNKNEKTYRTNYFWHFDCYREQSLAWAELNPYSEPEVGHSGGRKSMGFSQETKKIRQKLSVATTRVKKDMKYYAGHNMWEMLNKAREDLKIIRNQYEVNGGIPVSKEWGTVR